jgi:2-dehydro-3-deoxyphosphogluconate aldolase/(4S)-4-hydroxy-2-oxoglutarate aldolase
MTNPPTDLEAMLGMAPVVPVLIVEDRRSAVPLARALVAGGLPTIEITLRTGAALEAIRAVAAEVEGAVVGAGTVLTRRQFADAAGANARFVVSPGASSALVQAAEDSEIPFLPGAATATEAMTLLEYGYAIQKFFPAGPAGGPAYLKAFAAPLPGVRFCPTGGIDAGNAAEYLSLANVICVGGSWVAPQDAVAAGDWNRIERLAREAAGLGPRSGRGRSG